MNKIRHWIRLVEAVDLRWQELIRQHSEALDAYDAAKAAVADAPFGTREAKQRLQQARAALDAYSAEQDAKSSPAAGRSILPDIEDRRSPYATNYKPRGGFTADKIKKHLRTISGPSSAGSLAKLYDEKGRSAFAREIRKFDSPQDFAEHLFWHGTGGYVSGGLKPGSMLPKHTEFGGGYGEAYSVISLSKSKNIASNFTGSSSHAIVYPVILRKFAKVISMPDISDSQELEDILPALWSHGVDAVKIGDWSSAYSEQELCVVNPKAIIRGSGESYAVFQKKPFSNPTDAEIAAAYDQAVNPPSSAS